MELTGKRVVVFGLGASGRAAASLCARRGASVVGVDRRTDVAPIDGVALELGDHRRETFTSADVLVVSPGIPASHPHVVAAREAGVVVLGELALAAAFLDAPMVAITGTNGKSTVTSFTAQLLRAAGYRPFSGGNLGTPLSTAVGGDHDVLVVEVSSYQLELPGALSPTVAAMLNLSPDHLARHGSMEGYAAAKARLFDRMGPADLAVLPANDDRVARHIRGTPRRAFIGAHPGVVRHGASVAIRLPDLALDLDLSPLGVPGEHNRDNAATAALLAIAVGADPARVAAAVGELKALAHRMEIVADTGGVVWINDSKATNVDAARVGITGLDRPAVVLLGGQAKGRGFDVLAEPLADHRAVVTFGADGPAIAEELEAAGVVVHRAGDLVDAVAVARTLARPGDAVLLSPGTASFDAYDNFEHRGRHFRDLAREA